MLYVPLCCRYSTIGHEVVSLFFHYVNGYGLVSAEVNFSWALWSRHVKAKVEYNNGNVAMVLFM